ncbi:hypothetical protein OLMES_0410 [Oleiphilus messinensis]|uniref:Lipoprotein n=1 Tax=Oleiphilus messinensis TaxID=141451 RepID=A0A1Y0I4Y4_9GAMM|nr:hypothetical protein [Oleiphilus messinensis]ARU54514.1 hypothetical protein OLMES_0410 [Oleiphilus messinensis]
MGKRLTNLCVWLCLSLFLYGCSSTQIAIKTKPPGAEVRLINNQGQLKAKVVSDVSYKIENSNDYFTQDGVETTWVHALATKEGYRPGVKTLAGIRNGEKNDGLAIIALDKLDSTIAFETSPPGAKITFYQNKDEARTDWNSNKALPLLSKEYVPLARNNANLPPNISRTIELVEDHLKDVDYTADPVHRKFINTPFHQQYTADTVNQEFANIGAVKVEKEGYLPVIKEISIKGGESNVFAFQLQPWTTSLKVISEPEGVEIEDIARGTAFGYMGETPLIRKFTYDETAERKSTFWPRQKIMLMLRATKAGYEDEHVQVEIPFGEEIPIKVSLKRQSSEITFQSDPAGAHVYVKRIASRQVYDQSSGKLKDVPLVHWKHLGSTPFTYYMDPADPLLHGDVLKFERSGFKVDQAETYKAGVVNYHRVLVPLGDVIHNQALE